MTVWPPTHNAGMIAFILLPLAGLGVLAGGVLLPGNGWVLLACVPALLGAVPASVPPAEVFPHRVGEPLGTLGLAPAVAGCAAARVRGACCCLS